MTPIEMQLAGIRQTHKFEEAGLGKHPFRVINISENWYVAAPGVPRQPGGTCDYCSNGIAICCHIQSADGKVFIVGSDCVKKTGDEGLRKVAMRKINAQKRAAKDAARQAAREIELNAERERNDGFTDYEVAANTRRATEAAQTQTMTAANAWLIDALTLVSYQSDFVDSMKRELTSTFAKDLSPRCQQVLSEIYAKMTTGARKGTMAYQSALVEFEARVQL